MNKKKRGDIYAIKINETNEYIYLYYITGNEMYGDVTIVYDYATKELETDIDKILSQKSLYEESPIIAFIDIDYEKYILVGNKKPIWNEWRKAIYIKSSIKCNNSEENKLYKQCYENIYTDITKYPKYVDGESQAQQKDIQKGITYYYDDWDINEYYITGNRGKLDAKNIGCIGKLPKNMEKSFLTRCFPHYEDFISMYLNGFDRNSTLYNLYK